MPINYNPETGNLEATGPEKIICQMAGITPEQLENRRAGIDETAAPPDAHLLKLLGCSENDYWLRVAGIQEQSAEHWKICEGVLLKHYEKGRQLSSRELKHQQKEAEEAAKAETRRKNAIIAEQNRRKFFESQ